MWNMGRFSLYITDILRKVVDMGIWEDLVLYNTDMLREFVDVEIWEDLVCIILIFYESLLIWKMRWIDLYVIIEKRYSILL